VIAWLNFAVLVLSSILLTVYYVRSVRPAALEKRLGEQAWAKCATYRRISSVFMFVAMGNYIIYYWFPLPIPLPRTFPWPWFVSAIIAGLIAVPSLWLMFRGTKDAGEETMTPRPEHQLYGGIYDKIRHPQALGEFPLWWVVAFLLHSPFLALFSFVYVPVWFYFCIAEEADLVIRYGASYEQYRERTGFWLPRR
jgi:protein-S-isoprenylcysteine O-methyltransferase Ste14